MGITLALVMAGMAEAQDAPLWSADGTLRRLRLPILMYHYVSPLTVDADPYRRELTVEPSLFSAHMAHLQANGYTTLSLVELHNALVAGWPLPEKPIILTFDDGYRDHYDWVFPILKEYGFRATFFIITGYMDAGYPQYLSWAQAKEMQDAGMQIESHSKHHSDLRERFYDDWVYEMLGSYESIKDHLGEAPRAFSYPSGSYDEDVMAVLASIPYHLAVTTELGNWHSADDLLTLKRLRIYGNMPVENFAGLLEWP